MLAFCLAVKPFCADLYAFQDLLAGPRSRSLASQIVQLSVRRSKNHPVRESYCPCHIRRVYRVHFSPVGAPMHALGRAPAWPPSRSLQASPLTDSMHTADRDDLRRLHVVREQFHPALPRSMRSISLASRTSSLISALVSIHSFDRMPCRQEG